MVTVISMKEARREVVMVLLHGSLQPLFAEILTLITPAIFLQVGHWEGQTAPSTCIFLFPHAGS